MNDDERELRLKRWTQPPSDSEDQRAGNACRVITHAVRAAQHFAGRDIDVFIQGSYKNNTNVRLDSDVDICVCLKDSITTDYTFAPNLSDRQLGLGAASYPYSQFKTDLQNALISAFGFQNVRRGNKAFTISDNTFRVTADVVACLEHRRYAPGGTYTEGTSLFPDNGVTWVHNFPVQHYENGITKNNQTSGFFKDTVRIMKNLRNTMEQEGIAEAGPIASFFNECLVWNMPNQYLMLPTWTATVRATLVYLWENLESDAKCGEWGQVSELLYLFRGSYSRAAARAWVRAAWNWLELQ